MALAGAATLPSSSIATAASNTVLIFVLIVIFVPSSAVLAPGSTTLVQLTVSNPHPGLKVFLNSKRFQTRFTLRKRDQYALAFNANRKHRNLPFIGISGNSRLHIESPTVPRTNHRSTFNPSLPKRPQPVRTHIVQRGKLPFHIG